MTDYFIDSGIELFRCEKYQATMTRKSCAANWSGVVGKQMRQLERCHHCLGCETGAIHAGRAHTPKPLTRICCRCLRSASRLVDNRICISCYNREREWRAGVNARGTAPIHARKIYIIPLEIEVKQQQTIVKVESATKLEVALVTLRRDIQSEIAWVPSMPFSVPQMVGEWTLFRGC